MAGSDLTSAAALADHESLWTGPQTRDSPDPRDLWRRFSTRATRLVMAAREGKYG
jgi:hypothetical protein